MSKGITNTSGNFTFYERFVSPDELYSPDLVEENEVIPLPYGNLEIKSWYFDGLRISMRKQRYNDYYLFEKINTQDVVYMQFNLKGRSTIYQLGNEYDVKPHLHNIVYSKGNNNTFRNGALESVVFEIQFAPPVFLKIIQDSNEVLKRFADKMLEGKPVVLAPQSLEVTPDLEQAIQAIVNCRFTGGLKKMYLLSKSIEILVLQAEAYNRSLEVKANKGLNRTEKEKVLYAREYLIENVETPPSLSELSKIVGINEYNLKKGFKEVFNTTVFGYLSDYRLDTARQQLLDTAKTVSEIAYELGYSSPQHFSSAFRKKFGISPRDAKK